MKTFGGIACIIAALVAIIGVSSISVLREEDRLVDEFTSVTRQQVHASAEMLASRLDALEQHTRLLADMIEQPAAHGEADPLLHGRVLQGAFHALVIVVARYRIVALVGANGARLLSESDPTDPAATVQELDAAVGTCARQALQQHGQVFAPPARIGDRHFLLYGRPVSGERAIVVVSDASLFLGAVEGTPPATARLFVTGPSGDLWAGCETPRGCRISSLEAEKTEMALPVPTVHPRGSSIPRPLEGPLIQVAEPVERPTGHWLVTHLASTRKIVQQQSWAASRVIMTAFAAALTVAVVGGILLRQRRKAAELAVSLRYVEALARARETSQSIVEDAPLGVLGLSPEGRVVLVNRFFTDRVGPLKVGELLGDAFSSSTSERELVNLLLRELGKEGEGHPSQDRQLRADQQLRSVATPSQHFRVRIVPVKNRDLGIRVFALVEDQSELRSLESQLVRAEKLITVGVLSAGIAHEIGSPLAVIRGRAEQVLRVCSDGRQTEDLKVIIKHIDNITSTIRQVLDFSRQQAIAPRAVSLTDALDHVRSLLQWKLESRGLTLATTLPTLLSPLAADPDQLEQVLVNLLLNACDASSPGDTIELSAYELPPGKIEFAVVDHGCGIAPEHMNAVFDPFFTTKKRGEGTGLGLSIVASIVRNHGGQINLQSTQNVGTTVTVFWPASAEEGRLSAHG